MSVGLVTCLLFAAISINMIPVECSIKTAESGTSKSEKIMSVKRSILGGIWDSFNAISNGIYPGTKWCGVGNIAENGDDFGTSEQTDRCCKEHDGCETFITSGDTNYNLTNTASYTVSGCDCDQKLLDCMVDVATSKDAPAPDQTTAKNFGRLFFNIISPKCLKHDYPLVCVSVGFFGNCVEYKNDTSQPQVWQLVKGPRFPSL